MRTNRIHTGFRLSALALTLLATGAACSATEDFRPKLGKGSGPDASAGEGEGALTCGMEGTVTERMEQCRTSYVCAESNDFCVWSGAMDRPRAKMDVWRVVSSDHSRTLILHARTGLLVYVGSGSEQPAFNRYDGTCEAEEPGLGHFRLPYREEIDAIFGARLHDIPDWSSPSGVKMRSSHYYTWNPDFVTAELYRPSFDLAPPQPPGAPGVPAPGDSPGHSDDEDAPPPADLPDEGEGDLEEDDSDGENPARPGTETPRPRHGDSDPDGDADASDDRGEDDSRDPRDPRDSNDPKKKKKKKDKEKEKDKHDKRWPQRSAQWDSGTHRSAGSFIPLGSWSSAQVGLTQEESADLAALAHGNHSARLERITGNSGPSGVGVLSFCVLELPEGGTPEQPPVNDPEAPLPGDAEEGAEPPREIPTPF